ncbi:MAG: transposase [Lawsonibacter sp.]|nr:transposase [Lawsonibacter sp.]
MHKYDKEFKEEAVRLSDEVGAKQAAAQFGTPYYSLVDERQKANEILKDALGFFAKGQKK